MEYGYKIQVLAFQTPGLSISGEILGDVFEDYSDGVQNRYNLDKVTFDITKEGLVAHYSDEEITSKSQNIIAVVDVGGLNPFRIKVVPRNSMSQQEASAINSNAIGRLEVTTTGAQIIYQDKGETRDVLSIGLYRGTNSGENIVKKFSSNSSTNDENRPNFNSFNNQLVYPGDYLEIRFKAPSTFYIMGEPLQIVILKLITEKVQEMMII